MSAVAQGDVHDQIVALKLGNSVQQGFDRFFGYLPNIIGFLIRYLT